MSWLSEGERRNRYEKLINALDIEYGVADKIEHSVGRRNVDLSEFIADIELKNNIDTTLAIVYYYVVHKKTYSVKIDDIESAYEELRRTKPASIVQVLRELSSKKFDNRIVYTNNQATITLKGKIYIGKMIDKHDSDSHIKIYDPTRALNEYLG
jgi:hypothetical protein